MAGLLFWWGLHRSLSKPVLSAVEGGSGRTGVEQKPGTGSVRAEPLASVRPERTLSPELVEGSKGRLKDARDRLRCGAAESKHSSLGAGSVQS